MGYSGTFRKLSQLIKRYESDGGRVHCIEAKATNQESEAKLDARIDVPVSLCSNEGSDIAVSPQAATISDEGGLQIEFSPAALPELDEYVPANASAEREEVRVTDDGTVLTTFVLTFGVESKNQDSVPSTSAGMDSQTHSPSVTDMDAQSASDDATIFDMSDGGEAVEGTNDSGSAEVTPATIETSASDENDIASKLKAARNEDLPTYDDIEYLQCLYDSLDTFTEMSKHFEMDVASETVRRYMIDAQIHESASYNTADEAEVDDKVTDDDSVTEDLDAVDASAEGESSDGVTEDDHSSKPEEEKQVVEPADPIENLPNKTVVADGIGLPKDLTIEEIADAIESSMTVYQVQLQLDMSRERTGELLKQLNLIDLVRGRLADGPKQQNSREEIARRIRTISMN